MTNREIQQLQFDGRRLFCPDHPKRELEQTSIPRFGMICTAPITGAAGATCMKSAEWANEKEMKKDLGLSN
jgi:hypothetical protein